MLYHLGPLKIDVTPFNVDGVTRKSATDYAAKPILGKEPPLEYVGEGTTTMRLKGSIFPEAIGGMDELNLLQSMRASGKPQNLLRGDGAVLGWFAVLDVTEKHSHLGTNGVGNRIDVQINLQRAGRPSAFGLFNIIAGLLS